MISRQIGSEAINFGISDFEQQTACYRHIFKFGKSHMTRESQVV